MKKIMIISDCRIARLSIEAALTPLEISIFGIESSWRIIKRLLAGKKKKHSWDLIIFNISSETKRKLKLLTKLQQQKNKDIPVIILSSDKRRSIILQASELGIDDYILKPFDQQVLQDKVTNHLQNKTPLQQQLDQQPKQKIEDITSTSTTKPENEFPYFQVDLLQEISRSLRSGFPFSILELQLKNETGKEINKESLLSLIRSIDQAYSIKENNFLFLLPLTPKSGAKILIRRLQKQLQQHSFISSQLKIKALIEFPKDINGNIDYQEAVKYQNQLIYEILMGTGEN